MQQIAFAGLGAQSCAIIDAGSLDTFLNPDVIRWANSDELVRYAENRRTDGWSPDTTLKEIFTIIEGRNQIKETLLFLEKLVVYDTLVFDAMSIRRRFADMTHAPVLLEHPAMRQTMVPESVYADAHSSIKASRNSTARALERLQQPEAELRESLLVTFAGDENFHDELFDTPNLRRYSFAESTDLNAVERVIFYQCVAQAAGVPLALSPAKSEQLKRWDRRIAAQLNELIQNAVTDNVRQELHQIRDGIIPDDLQFPPISHRIVTEAVTAGQTLFEAALRLRDTVEARGYRELLHRLQTLATRGPTDRVRVTEMIARIRKQHAAWLRSDQFSQQAEPERGLVVRLAPLVELADLILPPHWIPVLWVFKLLALGAEALGRDEIRAMLPPDSGAGVRFISSWYSYSP